MERLKFVPHLVRMILDREKDTTWRLEGSRLSAGDVVALCYNDNQEFARAKVVAVKKKAFGKLNEEDMKGHEAFSSPSEMYETYSRIYKTTVTPATKVSVVKFKLISDRQQR